MQAISILSQFILFDEDLPPWDGLFDYPAGLQDRAAENTHQGHAGNPGELKDGILSRLTCIGVGTVFRGKEWHLVRE
ncbi:MAG TPA: hypothetical protein VMB35_05775 [Methanomicrobiales archaeon]|nr:hypothetical protein [Methanomicrobiales archaeon]